MISRYDYIITLKRPNYRFVNMVSVLLLLIFLLSFAYYFLQTGLQGQWLKLLIPAMIIGLMVYGFLRRHEKEFMVYYRTELMIAALGWFFMPLIAEARYVGWLYAAMAIIERFVKFPDEWGFTADKIVRNSFPKKTYQWFEIDNVVLRNNLFTLDLRNNKVVQKELDVPVDKEMEDEFNEYCQKQLYFQQEKAQQS